MEIRISSSEELEKLLDSLALDIVDANVYYQLFKALNESIPEFHKEFAQSNTFWYLTIKAIYEAYLTRLCRIFDQHSQSLNMVNLLDTIKANLHQFEESNFRERMKGNAFVDSLADVSRVPTLAQIDADIEFSSQRNEIVDKLMLWRGNVHAHKGAKVTLGKAKRVESNQIVVVEIELLLDRCFEMLNRYMSLYKATSWSRQAIGHDDYLSLLKLLRQGIEKREADIQRDYDSWKDRS